MELSMWIIILVVLIVALVLILIKPGSIHPPRINRQGRIEFYSKGMDAGFSLSEINLLWAAAKRADLSHPPSIYGSVEELDKAINQIAGSKKFSDRKGVEPETLILKKLFEYRKKVEMSRPKYRSGLKSTRNIAIGQKLTIRADGAGLYTSKVVEVEQGYLTITIPVGAWCSLTPVSTLLTFCPPAPLLLKVSQVISAGLIFISIQRKK